MKPQTKIQKEVEELSERLRPLPKYLLDKFYQATEECNRTRYYAVLEQVKGYSVVRYFKYIKHKRGENVCQEFMQVYMSEHGNAVRAKQRFSMGHYYDTFITDSPMKIRQNNRNYCYNRLTDIGYSKLFVRSRKAKRVICNYKENQYYMIGKGYLWLTDDMNVDKFPFLETILKQKPRIAELLLLNHIKDQDIVKLAWKHGYLTEDLDYNLWSDTVSMARHLNLDIHNPIYVCPQNLQTAHNLYSRRLNRQRAEEERRREEMRAMSDKKARKHFNEFIKKFLSLIITDGTVTIQPLKSIEEFRAEGKMMHHCVFDMGYYKKPDCLILSAQVNGKHMETIELNLKNFSIVQCRGFENDPSAYHNEIVQLMNKNMYKVKQLTKKRKEVA